MTMRLIYAILGSLSLAACGGGRGGDLAFGEDVQSVLSALPLEVSYPEQALDSAERVELGRLLFWDPVLSGEQDVACASCHHPDFAYADGLALSRGVGASGLGPSRRSGARTTRNAPTVLNTVFNGIDEGASLSPQDAPMFWDLRAEGLEAQARLPILSLEEMRGERYSEAEIMGVVLDRLNDNADYIERFERAYGTQPISEAQVLGAIAAFERTLVANDSPFDRYMRGDDSALTNAEVRGLQTFVDVGCGECHSGPMLSDFELHTLGVPDGPVDRGASSFDFRTPSLRNLSFTGPYMHNGVFDDLEDVVEFYEDISDGRNNAILSNLSFDDVARDARRLRLNRGDIDDIVRFLRTLDDDNFDRTIPASVPSGLPPGGNL